MYLQMYSYTLVDLMKRHLNNIFQIHAKMYNHNKRNLADMIINDEEETSTFHSEYSIRDTYMKLYESCSPIDYQPFANVKPIHNY